MQHLFTYQRLLARAHSAEQAAASLTAVLARRARGCSTLTLRELLHAPDSAPSPSADGVLELWRALLRGCAGARAVHVCLGDKQRDYCLVEKCNNMREALVGALPGCATSI